MVGEGDATRAALARPNGEVLAEGLGTLNRGLVVLGVLADLVVGTVRVNATDDLRAADGARVVRVVLNDVVLGEGVVEPSVNGVVRTLVGAVATAEVDHTVASTSGPAETDNEVLGVVPGAGVGAIVLVVLEVGVLAVVVLDVVDGLALNKGSSSLFAGGLGSGRGRGGNGSAGGGNEGEDSGELHLVL